MCSKKIALVQAAWFYSASSSHCDPPFNSSWSKVQQEHCCNELGVCPSKKKHTADEPHFNCLEHLHQWEKKWSKEKMEWCCEDLGIGCCSRIKTPPLPSKESSWIRYGDDKACRLSRSDHSLKGDGNGTVIYKGYPFDQTMQECQLYCESTWTSGRPAWMGEAPPRCTGIEWAENHCEIWTHEIGYAAEAKGFECIHYSATPVTIQSHEDKKVFVVEGDYVRAARYTARAQDVFHKLQNEDGTVSFLSVTGKFITAEEDGSVRAIAGAVGDWEKFHETSQGGNIYSYRSWNHKNLLALVGDGYVRATATGNNDRTKILVNPVDLADSEPFSCGPASVDVVQKWKEDKKTYCCENFPQDGCPKSAALRKSSAYYSAKKPQMLLVSSRATALIGFFLSLVMVAAGIVVGIRSMRRRTNEGRRDVGPVSPSCCRDSAEVRQPLRSEGVPK